MEKRIRRALLALLLVGLVLTFGSLVAQADPGPQGVDPYFDTHLGPVAEKPVRTAPAQPGAGGDLLDWSGIDWKAWLGMIGASPLGAVMAALTGLALVFGERLGIRERLWDPVAARFNAAWDLIRQTGAGWWATEILRRITLPLVGAGIWVIKLVAGIPGMVKGVLTGLVNGTVENIKTVTAFIRADGQGKVKIIQDKISEVRSGWETVKALPGLLWDDVKTRWSRGWNGLVRMWTDPNVSNEELLQWGADHVSMVSDVAIVVPVVGAAVRGVKGASWLGEVNEAVVVARSARAGTLGGMVDDLGRVADDFASHSALPGVVDDSIGQFPRTYQGRSSVSASVKGSSTPQLESKTSAVNHLENSASRTASKGAKEGTVASRIDYSKGFEDDLENFLPGYRLFSGPLEEDLILVQFHRGDRALDAGRSAKWWTTPEQALQVHASTDDIRQILALPPAWGPRDSVSIARIPKGTHITFYEGKAARQVSDGVRYNGGGAQFRFKEFDASWIIVDSKPVTEFDPSWIIKTNDAR